MPLVLNRYILVRFRLQSQTSDIDFQVDSRIETSVRTSAWWSQPSTSSSFGLPHLPTSFSVTMGLFRSICGPLQHVNFFRSTTMVYVAMDEVPRYCTTCSSRSLNSHSGIEQVLVRFTRTGMPVLYIEMIMCDYLVLYNHEFTPQISSAPCRRTFCILLHAGPCARVHLTSLSSSSESCS